MAITLDGTAGINTPGVVNTAAETIATTLGVTGVSTLTGGAVIQGLTVGRGAGAVATNTAVGASALAANTTGNFNTAIGRNAGLGNTDGFRNTFVGQSAGTTNSSGYYLTAVGDNSLLSNTSGLNNTALGKDSLFSNTTASNNTAVGYQAGFSNTTASNNTAVGYQAGYSATTGAGNTLVGKKAGYSLTTGYNNTFIGFNDTTNRASGDEVTTGNRHSIIGAYTGNQGGLDIRTLSNYIVLSDGDGNPRIVSDNNGNVGVGATNPAYFSGKLVSNADGASIAPFALNNSNTGSSSQIVFDIYRNATRTGSITNTNTATAYVTSSDYRLKNSAMPITGALAKVALLKPVTYKWNVDGSDGEGFIAHELAEVCPQAVHGEKDAVDENGNPKYQGIDTSFLVATLTAAIQELNTKFEEYKSTHP